MRRLIRFLLLSLALPLAAACDSLGGGGIFSGGSGTPSSRLIDCYFGYVTEHSKLEELFGHGSDVFVGFTSKEDFDRLLEMGTVDSTAFLRNRFEYRKDEYSFRFQCVPEKSRLHSVEVTSSDPGIIEVLSSDPDGVKVKFHSLGDVDLTVHIEGNQKTIDAVFPLEVIGTVNVKFTITPFWLRKVATKIRMNTKKLPEGMKDLVIWTKDSIDVVGYCEWYDFEKFGREEQALRDTVSLPTEEFMTHYKKHTHYLVRNVTEAMKTVSSKSIEGSVLQEKLFGGGYDTVAVTYDFVPQEVILYWQPVCDNPFIEFTATVTSKKTFDQYPEGEEPEAWSEESDDIGDVDIEIVEEDGEDDDAEEENDKETVNYFKVTIGDFLAPHVKDSLMRELDRFKKEAGFDYELSDEDKDKAIDKINENLDPEDRIEAKARRRWFTNKWRRN